MNISKLAIKRPVVILSITIMAVLFGIIGYINLPVDFMPEMEMPKVTIMTVYPGAGPSEVEELVTKVLEEEFSSLSGLEGMSSKSSAERSVISLSFDEETDFDVAASNVIEKINGAAGQLPDDAMDPVTKKFDINARPVYTLAVSSEEINNIEELNVLVEDQIVKFLQRVEGVASVELSGNREKQLTILLDREEMYGYNLSINNIVKSINDQNVNAPIGSIDKGNKEISIRLDGEIQSIEDIRNLPLVTSAGTVKLSEIAAVEEGYKDTSSYSYYNGNPSIRVAVNKQSNANTVDVASAVNDEVERIRTENPEMVLNVEDDQSVMINDFVDSVKDAGLIGAFFAVLVLFIFLQHIRSTVIIAIAIPISIIFTFALMYVSGVGINMVSLMGLALGIGMLVDNGIVVIENIFRLKKQGQSILEATKNGVSEVGLAISSSTLTSIAVFLPLVFTGGFTAQVFRDMSLTITFSLVSSLLVALTLVPVMSVKLLSNTHYDDKRGEDTLINRILTKWDKGFERMEERYERILASSLDHKKRVIIGGLFILILTFTLIPRIGMEFMPAMETNSIGIGISLPKGTVTDKTIDVVDEVEVRIEGIDEIKDIHTKINSNEASVTLSMREFEDSDRSLEDVLEAVREDLKTIPGVEIEVNAIGVGLTSGKPVSLDIYGPDYEVLKEISEDMEDIIERIPGTREVSSTISDEKDEMIIEVDRERAAKYGLTPGQISGELRGMVTGNSSASYRMNNEEIDIRIAYDDKNLDSLQSIGNLPISTPGGGKVPLEAVADLKMGKVPSTIVRIDQIQVVTISSALTDVDPGTIQKAIKSKLREYDMPEGYSYDFGGELKSMTESFDSLLLALLISIGLIYFIMSAQFESFAYPFIIMFSVPFAMTGGILALYVTNTPLSIMGLLGLIMLVGMVVNNAIVLIEYINQLRKSGYECMEALLKAAPVRLKPILMTTATTVLGMLPMAIGIGDGADMQVALARTLVGGLLLSTIVTLIIIPVNYAILDGIRNRRKER